MFCEPDWGCQPLGDMCLLGSKYISAPEIESSWLMKLCRWFVLCVMKHVMVMIVASWLSVLLIYGTIHCSSWATIMTNNTFCSSAWTNSFGQFQHRKHYNDKTPSSDLELVSCSISPVSAVVLTCRSPTKLNIQMILKQFCPNFECDFVAQSGGGSECENWDGR